MTVLSHTLTLSTSEELQEKFRSSVRKCVERYIERLDRGAEKHSDVHAFTVDTFQEARAIFKNLSGNY